jgi:hypothetical protein
MCNIYPDSAKMCNIFPESAKMCNIFPESAKICNIFPESAEMCNIFPDSAKMCNIFPESAKICNIFPEYAKICNIFPESAMLRNALSDSKLLCNIFSEPPPLYQDFMQSYKLSHFTKCYITCAVEEKQLNKSVKIYNSESELVLPILVTARRFKYLPTRDMVENKKNCLWCPNFYITESGKFVDLLQTLRAEFHYMSHVHESLWITRNSALILMSTWLHQDSHLCICSKNNSGNVHFT